MTSKSRTDTKRRGLLAGVTATVIAAITWAARDYRSWRALGPGGLPPHPGGWLITTGLRLIGRNRFRVRHPDADPDTSTLQELPSRTGSRPQVSRHPVPHRVVGQQSSASLTDVLRSVLDEYGKSPLLEHRTSQWEKHHRAVFLRGDEFPNELARAAGGEILHLHPFDGSLHVMLSPADAQLVIDRGWGELHPLAGARPGVGLPATYTLIYPPRTIQDLVPTHVILTAAVRHMTGRPGPGSRRPF